jgi:hypothetical protein
VVFVDGEEDRQALEDRLLASVMNQDEGACDYYVVLGVVEAEAVTRGCEMIMVAQLKHSCQRHFSELHPARDS